MKYKLIMSNLHFRYNVGSLSVFAANENAPILKFYAIL